MSGRFELPISIKEAIIRIDKREYLLPAIQREFVWSHTQIEKLFDSILRGYPINSFMFWKIKDSSFDLKDNYHFYEILKEYRARYKIENPPHNTKGMNDFLAIIDGQQRLTSIYIGLKGTYAYKMPRKHWIDNEENLPTRKLYLNLKGKLTSQKDTDNIYDFRFLTPNDTKDEYSFEVGKILSFENQGELCRYALNNNWQPGSFAWDTLNLLYEKINTEKLINYYLEEEQDPNLVLNVFIRTNSGGKPLSFSDLLMSMSTATWKINAKEEITKLKKEVFDLHHMGFEISQDFILKTCLVLCDFDVRFKLTNFKRANIAEFEKNWIDIKKSIISGIELIYHLGHNNYTIQAKNALIPIIYYIYKNKLADKICKNDYFNRNIENNINIQKWLNISLLKGIFGGHSDSTLTKLRNILKGNSEINFPFIAIVDAFKRDNINYNFDDEFLEELLNAQKDTKEANCILTLLYPHMDYYHQNYHADHLHPKSRIKIIANEMTNENDKNFVEDVNNWNSVINLQLLEGDANSSKNDTPLKEWAKNRNKTNMDLLLPSTTSLEERDFVEFIKNRKKFLKQKLQALVK